MIFEFGKYRGQHIEDVPDSYLLWLIKSNNEKNALYQAELDRRDSMDMASMSWMERMIKIGFKELCKKHHPDVGGSTVDMQEINASYDALKRAMEGRRT